MVSKYDLYFKVFMVLYELMTISSKNNTFGFL